MNNLKRKVSLILSVIMLALAIFPLTISSAASQVSMTTTIDGKVMSHEGTYKVQGGETVVAKASSSVANIERIGYYYEENGFDSIVDIYKNTISIIIPDAAPGTRKVLCIEAIADNDDGTENIITKTGWYRFNLVYEEDNVEEVPVEVKVKHAGKTLKENSTTVANPGDIVELSATPAQNIKRIYYRWDKESIEEIAAAKGNISVPTTFAPGTTHKLYVLARDNYDVDTIQKIFIFEIPSENMEDDDLDILPWEKESKDLDSLAISLRNDSESDKANKNVYALEEEVTYFVDFKNGGKGIKDEVVITLELPLEFEVIDSANGTVNGDTITWVYPNGMEEGYEGTKTVKVKYVAFDRSSTDSERIYPVARIAKEGKNVDDSAVINFIYRDEDTVIEDTHEPYMYGDKNATTFRPNDTITRDEGALVLARIVLGQEAINNVKITSVYPDLDATYEEAQKAIVLSTSYGIINGYTDGYYRPKQTMTRAEFMKILAKFVELDGEDNGIDGLAIKDLEDSVKMYKDPQNRYAVNGTLITNHWAIEEVSLLTRLNMTSVSSNKDLRMDEGITRAEVAQLVNFFLLRAPAEVTSKTKTEFSDVNKRHDLFADIVEATRDAHDFRITEDGTEIAE